MLRKLGILLGLILLLVVAVVRSHPPQAAAPAQPPLVHAVAVRQENLHPVETISGQAEAWRSALVASEVAGRILRRPHQGDSAVQGQIILDIDPEMAEAERDQAQAAASRAWAAVRQAEADYDRAEVETAASVRQAQAQLDNAEAAHARVENGSRPQELRTAEAALQQAQADEALANSDAARYQQLLQEGAIAPQTWDQAQDRQQTARSRRQQAEAALSLAREGARPEDRWSSRAQVETAQAGVQTASTRNLRLATLLEQLQGLRAQAAQADAALRQSTIALDRHHVRAPFAGRILATPVEVGELVAPGTPVVRLGDVHRIKATFSVDEQTRRTLSLGTRIAVGCDALPGHAFHGRLTTLGFQADPRTRTFPVEVAIDNRQQSILPGMVLRFTVPSPARSTTVVPVSAVATDGAVPYVYVLEGGRAERRPVHLGAPAGGDVVVEDGVRPGELVAANPQRLTDGALLRVAP